VHRTQCGASVATRCFAKSDCPLLDEGAGKFSWKTNDGCILGENAVDIPGGKTLSIKSQKVLVDQKQISFIVSG
jgi:hypothetical protein